MRYGIGGVPLATGERPKKRPKMTRYSFTLPEDLDAAIDKYCAEINWNKSTFIRFCVRYSLMSIHARDFIDTMSKPTLDAVMNWDAIQMGRE